MNTKKEIFVATLLKRTKNYTLNIISFVDTLKKSKASSVITYQILKSASSVSANYRAACRGRSKKEFFAKICIVVEEADETLFWLEIIQEANLSRSTELLQKLIIEGNEILKIMAKAKNSTYS
jgi:four helix bundle protein